MIEDVITRMGSNSFLIKGWSMTALGGLITIYFANIKQPWSYYLLVFGAIMCIIFWANDAYFLKLERKYRALYKKVSEQDEDEIDFSMAPLDTKDTVPSCMLSQSFLMSYAIIELIFLILLYWFKPC